MNRREEREPWGCTWGKKGTRYRRGLEGHQARVRPVKSREGGGMRDTPPRPPGKGSDKNRRVSSFSFWNWG